MLTAISPVDGRYEQKTQELSEYFSEFALIKYRVFIEIQYFLALCELPLPQLEDFPAEKADELIRLSNRFSLDDAHRVKDIERTTNHDVKAVEYFLKGEFSRMGNWGLPGIYPLWAHFTGYQ